MQACKVTVAKRSDALIVCYICFDSLNLGSHIHIVVDEPILKGGEEYVYYGVCSEGCAIAKLQQLEIRYQYMKENPL